MVEITDEQLAAWERDPDALHWERCRSCDGTGTRVRIGMSQLACDDCRGSGGRALRNANIRRLVAEVRALRVENADLRAQVADLVRTIEFAVENDAAAPHDAPPGDCEDGCGE